MNRDTGELIPLDGDTGRYPSAPGLRPSWARVAATTSRNHPKGLCITLVKTVDI